MALTLNGDDGIAGVNGSATTPAIQGTDTNTGLTFGTDTVNVVTGGSTRATVDSSGRVGIGTTTPGDYDAAGDDLVISGSGEAGITIASGTSSGGNIYFADGTTGNEQYRGWITYSHNTDALRLATAGTERMRIDSSGRAMIGTTSVNHSGAFLSIDVDASGSQGTAYGTNSTSSRLMISFNNPNGEVGHITTNGSNTSYNTSSDYRLKENVVDLDGAISRVKQLAPKRFNFIADPGTTVDGFIAHEAQGVVPEAVVGTHNEVQVWQEGEELPESVSIGDTKLDEDGNPIPKYQGIDQSKLVPLLTAALQEAISKIEALETRVAQLEGGAS